MHRTPQPRTYQVALKHPRLRLTLYINIIQDRMVLGFLIIRLHFHISLKFVREWLRSRAIIFYLLLEARENIAASLPYGMRRRHHHCHRLGHLGARHVDGLCICFKRWLHVMYPTFYVSKAICELQARRQYHRGVMFLRRPFGQIAGSRPKNTRWQNT